MNYIAPRVEPLIREIPLSRLAFAPENVRKTPPDPRADAETQGLDRRPRTVRNLVVRSDASHTEDADRYAVVAGGRRLKAMQALVEDKVIDADHPVCARLRSGHAPPGVRRAPPARRSAPTAPPRTGGGRCLMAGNRYTWSGRPYAGTLLFGAWVARRSAR